MRVWVLQRTINFDVNSNYNYSEDFPLERTRYFSNTINGLNQESWPQRIRNWFIRVGIFSVVIFSLLVIFMGFITALYLLPIWGSILFVYWLVQNKK